VIGNPTAMRPQPNRRFGSAAGHAGFSVLGFE